MRRFLLTALGAALFSAHLFAGSDDYSDYRQSFQPTYQTRVHFEPPPENRFVDWLKDLFQGAVKGDAIEKPTPANVTGQVAIAFTPVAPAAFARDFAVDSYKSAMTGFQSYKKEAALAAVGMIPVVGEVRKLATMYKVEREAVLADRAYKAAGYVRDATLVRETLPALKATYAAEFEGEVRIRTFKAGEKVYRSPRNEYESAFEPGNWFGTRKPATKTGADSLYQAGKFGNNHEIVRTYEFKQDVTAYYGKVKGGTGYQLYIPEDIQTGSVLRWTDMRALR